MDTADLGDQAIELSVIIPVHDTAEFLRECLDSVLGQGIAGLEILTIDDGSTDDSPQILAEYAQDNRIRVITQEASGAARARNQGLEVARGEFVTFLDSDDCLPPTAYRTLLAAARRDTADIVTGVAESFTSERRWLNEQMREVYAAAGGPMRFEDAPVLARDSSTCTKIIRRALLEQNHLRFPEGIDVREDLHLAFRAYAAAKRITVIPNVVYHYRLRPPTAMPSVTQLATEKTIRDLLFVHSDLEPLLTQVGPAVALVFQQGIVANLMYRLERALAELEAPAAEALLVELHALFERLTPEAFVQVQDRMQCLLAELIRNGLVRETRLASTVGVDLAWVDLLRASGGLRHESIVLRLCEYQQARINLLRRGTVAAKPAKTRRIRTGAKRFWNKTRSESLQTMREAKVLAARALPTITAEGSKNRRIWVVGERRGNSAEDTGYRFFTYLRQERPDIDAYFVTSESVAQTLPDTTNVLTYGSLRTVRALVAAEAVVYSDGGVDVYRHWERLRPRLSPALVECFLQHGVIAINGMRGYYHREAALGRGDQVDVFVTSSEREKQLVVQRLGYDPEAVAVTGLSRFDDLPLGETPEREILLMPTWRPWLRRALPSLFTASEFYRTYRALLERPELYQLLERFDYHLAFHSHFATDVEFPQLTQMGPRVRVLEPTAEPLRDVIRRAALLITDYSSVSFDFALRYRPTIYYMFDKTRWQAISGSLGVKLSQELPGPIMDSAEAVLSHLEQILANDARMDPQYVSRSDSFFAYRDGNNCRRIAEAIEQAIERKRARSPE